MAGAGEDVILLKLQTLSETDPLFSEKKILLDSRDLSVEFVFQVCSSEEELLRKVERLIQAARILHLNEIELYFVEDDDCGPFTPRNELESLNSVIALINSSLVGTDNRKAKALELLRETTFRMITHTVSSSADRTVAEDCDDGAEELLLDWGMKHGVRTKLKISHFKGQGRGAVAVEDMDIGDTALEIPESLLISEGVLFESEMYDILKKNDSLSFDTMLLLWSMKERYNISSKYRFYFKTLPQEFNTGLRFGINALAALEGTLLFEEIMQAREHLRQQYDALCPILCADYPGVFTPALYTWEHFLWACELWYSNSMKVVFADGNLRTCLVPIAGLLNHSIRPHILHYGKVDSLARTLKFNLSRPCNEGDQCFLSYGNYSSAHLITFYGFIPHGDNPNDVIPIDFDACEDSCSHMVRGTWLTKKANESSNHGLPSRLLVHLNALVNDSDMEMPKQNDRHQKREVFEIIKSIFDPMMVGLSELDQSEREEEEEEEEDSTWDLKLALKYIHLQKRIVCSVLSSCNEALRVLDRCS